MEIEGSWANRDSRSGKIDTLRCLGTLLVILAHVDPPYLLGQARTFDVVLLVLLSGMTAAMRPARSYAKYLVRRCKKLLAPTYITITAVFATSYILCSVIGRSQLYDWGVILKSYLFLDGIGYIWITKVYLMIAAVSPIMWRVVDGIHSDWNFIGAVSALSCANEFIVERFAGSGVLLDEYFLYAVPYSLVAMLGMRLVKKPKFADKLLPFAAVAFSAIQAYWVYRGWGFSPSSTKFPPRAYYLAYGILISTILFRAVSNKTHPLMRWVSMHSFSIYLVHIVVLMGVNMFIDLVGFGWMNVWIVKYVLVVLASSGTVWFAQRVRASRTAISANSC